MTDHDRGVDPSTTVERWVIGVDGSHESIRALDWAVAHGRGRAGEVDVVTAWQSILPGLGAGLGAAPVDAADLRACAEATSRRAIENLPPGIEFPVRSVVAHGGPSAALLDAADHASLLVVGNRGNGGFSRLVLGSTSHQCATHASVPTAIVAKTEPNSDANIDTSRILVGFDGSPNSTAALHWALGFAQTGSSVHVVSAWDTSPLTVGTDQFFFPEASAIAEERFDFLLDDAISAHANADSITITREFTSGPPRAVLAEHSSRADLIVVGARGHGAIGSALLGSVSSWLLHHVGRPLVVVPAMLTT